MNRPSPFAVAIAAYNRADLIAGTLESIFAQTLQPVEVAVVDDGSSDDLASAVAPYRDRILFERIENSGVEGGRRYAISLTSAPWVAWCDSDDLWTPDHLANFDRALEIFPDADFLISNFRTFGDDALDVPDHFARWPREWFARYVASSKPPFSRLNDDALFGFIRRNLCFPSACAYRRAFYDSIGGTDVRLNRQRAADANFTRRALGSGAVTVLDSTPTVLIRKGDMNISRDVTNSLQGKIRLLRLEVEEAQIPRRFCDTALNVACETEVHLFWSYIRAGRDGDARNLARSLDRSKLDAKTKLVCWILSQPRGLWSLVRRVRSVL